MDIHTVTSSGEYGRNEPLSELYRELDRLSNAFLDGEKREAGALLGQLAKGADPREIQEQIDALFMGRRAELKKSLMEAFPQLGRRDAESYLNEWEEAWSSHFNAGESRGAVKGSEPSPMELFASGAASNPLETALAQAKSWQQSLSGSSDTGAIQLAAALVNKITALINAGQTSLDELQAWTTQTYGSTTYGDFIMDGSPYSGVDEIDVTTWFSVAGLGPPTFSRMDDYASQILAWKYEGTCAQPAILEVAFIEMETVYLQSKGSGQPIDFGAMQQWFQNYFINSTFGGYPQMLSHPDQIYRYMQIFGLSMTSDLAIAEIKALPSTAVNQAALQELQSQPFSDFANWAKGLYWNFPGLSQGDANPLYYIAMLGAAPPPTAWETLHAEVVSWAGSFAAGSQDAELANQLLAQMTPTGGPGDLTRWLTTFTAHSDIYMQYPDALQTTMQQAYTYAGGTLPPPFVPMDQQFKLAYDWNTASAQDLKSALLQEMRDVGSNGKFSDVTAWAKSIVEGGFRGYSPSPAAKAAFMAITGVTSLSEALDQAKAWQNSTTPGSEANALATRLVNEIETLMSSGGSMTNLQAWLSTTFTTATQDVYWQYPGLLPADADQLYLICIGSNAPPPTPMDQLYVQVSAWAQSFGAGSADAQLANALLQQIKALGSHPTDPNALNEWVQSTFTPQYDIYMQYPDASPDVMQQVYTYAGAGTLRGPNTMDQQFKLAYDWQPTSDAGKNLRAALISQMIAFHSNGQFGNVTLWAQVLVRDNFLNYPGVSAADQTTFEEICATAGPSNPFASIQAEIAQYLADRQQGFQGVLTHFDLPFPQTAAQWETLLRLCKNNASKLEFAMQECHSPADWTALAEHFHLPQGPWQQIQQEANALLIGMQGAGGYRSAVSLFNSALSEINTLENEKPPPPLSVLQDWAKGVNLSNYPGLTANDLAEFQKLINL